MTKRPEAGARAVPIGCREFIRLAAAAGAILAPDPRATFSQGGARPAVVVAEASDGYKVVYALSELDDQFKNVPVIVAISQNGGPLPSAEGPFRIAMGGGGEHRARWLRNLARLRLVRVAP